MKKMLVLLGLVCMASFAVAVDFPDLDALENKFNGQRDSKVKFLVYKWAEEIDVDPYKECFALEDREDKEEYIVINCVLDGGNAKTKFRFEKKFIDSNNDVGRTLAKLHWLMKKIGGYAVLASQQRSSMAGANAMNKAKKMARLLKDTKIGFEGEKYKAFDWIRMESLIELGKSDAHGSIERGDFKEECLLLGLGIPPMYGYHESATRQDVSYGEAVKEQLSKEVDLMMRLSK